MVPAKLGHAYKWMLDLIKQYQTGPTTVQSSRKMMCRLGRPKSKSMVAERIGKAWYKAKSRRSIVGVVLHALVSRDFHRSSPSLVDIIPLGPRRGSCSSGPAHEH